jgi:hypothetical protein
MKQAERQTLLEQVRGQRQYSDCSSEDSLDVETTDDESAEHLLKQYHELETRHPKPKRNNRLLRILRAPKVRISDFADWNGDSQKRALHQQIRLVPKMLRDLKKMHYTKESSYPAYKPVNRRPNQLKFSQKDKPSAAEEARKKKREFSRRKVTVLRLLCAGLRERLLRERERKLKCYLERKAKCSNFGELFSNFFKFSSILLKLRSFKLFAGYTRVEIDSETKRKELLQKNYSLYSKILDDKKDPKKGLKKDSHDAYDGGDHTNCTHHSHRRSTNVSKDSRTRILRRKSKDKRRRSQSRSKSKSRGRFRKRSSSRRSRKSRTGGSPPPPRLKTKSDFIFEVPLKHVKATQKWIDSFFPESVWKLNEPLPDPAEDVEFDDDEDDNYVWLEDYNEMVGVERIPRRFDEQLPIPPEDLEKIHAVTEAPRLRPGTR